MIHVGHDLCACGTARPLTAVAETSAGSSLDDVLLAVAVAAASAVLVANWWWGRRG